MEYYAKSPMDSIESGAISSMLTSFGRTNGIPNSISPLIAEVQDRAPWGGLYSVVDINGHRELSQENAFANGFDTRYTPSQDTATALMTIADAASMGVNDRPPSPFNAALLRQLEYGTYGLTVDQIESVAKTQVAPLVRVGLFNERDADGMPIGYPFVDLSAASPVALDASNPEHQATALQGARESIVLLKNDDVLPLDEDASLAVVGPLSDARFRTTRALRTPELPGAGLTPQQGIIERATGSVTTATDGDIVALRSVANGQFLQHGEGSAPTVAASAADIEAASLFESFAWGQEAYSLRSEETGRWLRYASQAVSVSGTEQFGTSRTEMPYRLRVQENGDGTVSFVVENYTTSFAGGFETRYFTTGRYLTVDPATNQVGVTGVLTDAETAEALNTDATKFTVETVREAGTQARVFAAHDGAEYAVVVVGAPPRHSAGEGSDRSDMNLGAEQYELVENVSAAYPGRTIVVISSTYPVVVDEVQKNDDVAAIVHLPDNGAYGGLALGQALFGDYSPSGRLSHTWYASMDALPPLNEYSIPEGADATIGREDLDPRFSVDMTAGDPYATGLTYAYTDAPVTYEFGYGLSYSHFEFGPLQVSAPGRSSSTLSATTTVTNTGDIDAAEVVQLYAAHPESSYGDAAPKRQLVAFTKVEVPAGATKKVTLSFDSEALALWNPATNRLDVESGKYTFMAGRSSDDIQATARVNVQGVKFGKTDASTSPINVFDHSFKASDVVYREASKQNTVEGLQDDQLVNGYYAVMSRAAGAWTAINDVQFRGAKKAVLSVASTNSSSSIELRLGSKDGPKLGEASFVNTGGSEYVIPGSKSSAGDVPVREIAYESVTIAFDRPVTGTDDLYIVFGDKDVRVRDIQVVTAGR
jgi:beta-glucosidase